MLLKKNTPHREKKLKNIALLGWQIVDFHVPYFLLNALTAMTEIGIGRIM